MKNKLYVSIILVVTILAVINLISQSFFLRLDFSESQQYTLSKSTKDILKNLTEPVTIKAYFSENLPPNVAQARKDFKDMLIEYNNRSKGMVVYQFINPNENEELEQEAIQNGIRTVMIDVREKDQIKQQKAYLGAVVSIGEQKEAIPLIQPGASLEYTLSKAIKKLTVVEKPTIGLLQGHGEPSIQEIPQAYNELSVLYTVEPLTLSDSTAIPERIKTLLILHPKDTIPPQHISQIDNFLAKGAHIMLAFNSVDPQLQQGNAGIKHTGFENWLRTKGVNISDNLVIDAACNQIQVIQNQNGFQMVSNIQFPYFPSVKKFGKHPIGGGIENLIFPFVSPIEYTGDASKTFSPIAYSSDKSGIVNLPTYFNIEKQWTENDFPKKEIILAASLEGKLAGNTESKMVIIGNGDFAINGPQDKAQQVNPDNINFLVNGIDWLSDDTGLIELRTKAVTARPIDELSDTTKTTLKWLNFLLPIILIVIYGFIRSQIKRNQRIKRMEENYV
jgi:gliding-associated putative ABC transporter substrate-binding component GldG